jgi:hypothetical protein
LESLALGIQSIAFDQLGMEQHVSCILIDYRGGRYRKGVAIYKETQVNLQQKP